MMNHKDHIEVENQLDLCKEVLHNIKLSHDRLKQAQRWNSTEMAQWLYSESKRDWRIKKHTKANEFWQRKFRREIVNLIKLIDGEKQMIEEIKKLTH